MGVTSSEDGSTDARRLSPSVRRYVGAVSSAGLVTVAVVAALAPGGTPPAVIAGFLCLLMAVAASTPIRLQTNAGIRAFTLEVAVFVAMALVLPIRSVPLLHVLSSVVGHVARRREPLKVVFNGGMVGFVSAVSILPFWLLGPEPDVFSVPSVVAVAAAGLTYEIANVLILGGLFERLGARQDGGTALQVLKLHGTILVGNGMFGLVLAQMAVDEPIAVLVAGALMVAVFLGFRGYLGRIEESERTELLEHVTHTLASATGSQHALGRFLEQVARLFGGERAEMVVIVRYTARYLTLDADGCLEDRTGEPLPRLLDQALQGGPALLHFETDAEANHRDALTAPLKLEGKTVGALAVYDRHGLEPWDQTDVKLLATLANEAAVAVRNVELVSELSEETRKLGNIVSAASDGIALLDQVGRVATWNPAFARMTGLPPDAAIGRTWDEVLPTPDTFAVEQLRRSIESVLAGAVLDASCDLHVERTTDDLRWLRCTFAPVEADGPGREGAGAVVIARDVTREREVEQLKADFIATVSHELRTPLTPLKGFLATAERHWDALDREQLREMMTSMGRQVERLETLIADLLVVADLDRPTTVLRRGEIDLGAMIDTVADTVVPEHAERLLTVAHGTVRGAGDPAAVQRIVRALVDNALKHTGSAVTVTAAVEHGEAVVRVTDEGPGIPAWERDVIFERFGRLGDHLTRRQGPGLGLAIARSLTERIGGRLELDSTPGSGSTFTLALPLASQEGVVLPAG